MRIKDKIIEKIARFLMKYYHPRPTALKTNLGIVPLEFPKEGGIQSHIPDADYPFPGMPDEKVVGQISTLKRMMPVACKYAWIALRDNIPDPKLYSRPVREIHRVMSIIREREGEKEMRGKWTEIRDIICMMMEFDDAYRFRLMDAMKEINLKEFEFTEADKYWAKKKWKYDYGFDKEKQ